MNFVDDRIVAFEELGMEAIREFYVENMPIVQNFLKI